MKRVLRSHTLTMMRSILKGIEHEGAFVSERIG